MKNALLFTFILGFVLGQVFAQDQDTATNRLDPDSSDFLTLNIKFNARVALVVANPYRKIKGNLVGADKTHLLLIHRNEQIKVPIADLLELQVRKGFYTSMTGLQVAGSAVSVTGMAWVAANVLAFATYPVVYIATAWAVEEPPSYDPNFTTPMVMIAAGTGIMLLATLLKRKAKINLRQRRYKISIAEADYNRNPKSQTAPRTE